MSYHIPLLRDLHDHFPDLLYRPERFRSVSDVLQYVIRVANQSPYRRGRQQFMSSFEEIPVRSPSFMPFPAPTMPSAPLAPVAPVAPSAPSVPSAPSAPAASSLSHMVFDIFSDANGPSSMDPQLIQFLGSLGSMFQNMEAPIGASSGAVGLTSDVITRSTHLETAQQTQEDQCAICQDHMTEGQSLRTILHCHHVFHQTCIDVWFQTHATCPTCRHRLS
jgi:Ring finger domain